MAQQIFPEDVKFFASERMDQTEHGGGWLTGNEIVSGQMNNAFKQIARIQRVYGSVELLRMGARVMTDNTALYAGSHVALTDPPIDPEVSFVLFPSQEPDEKRPSMVDRIEGFYTPLGGAGNAPLRYPVKPGDRQLVFTLRHKEYTPSYKEDGSLDWVRKVDVHYALNLNVGDRMLLPGMAGVSEHENDETIQIERIEIREERLAGAEARNEYHLRFMLVTVAAPLLRNHEAGVTPRTMVVDPGWRAYGAALLAEDVTAGQDRLRVVDHEVRLAPVIQRETRVEGMKLFPPPSLGEVLVETEYGDIPLNVSQPFVSEWLASATETLYTHTLTQGQPKPGTMKIMYLNSARWQVIEETDTSGTLSGAGYGTVNGMVASFAVNEAVDPGTHILFFYQLLHACTEHRNIPDVVGAVTGGMEPTGEVRQEAFVAEASLEPQAPNYGVARNFTGDAASTWDITLPHNSVFWGRVKVYVSRDVGQTWQLAAWDTADFPNLAGNGYTGTMAYHPPNPTLERPLARLTLTCLPGTPAFDASCQAAVFYKGGNLAVDSYGNLSSGYHSFSVNKKISEGSVYFEVPQLSGHSSSGGWCRVGFKDPAGNSYSAEFAKSSTTAGEYVAQDAGGLARFRMGFTQGAGGGVWLSGESLVGVDFAMTYLTFSGHYLFASNAISYGDLSLGGRYAPLTLDLAQQQYYTSIEAGTLIVEKQENGSWTQVLADTGGSLMSGLAGWTGSVSHATAQVFVEAPGLTPGEAIPLRISGSGMKNVMREAFSAPITLPVQNVVPGASLFRYWTAKPGGSGTLAWLAQDDGAGKLMLSDKATVNFEPQATVPFTGMNLSKPFSGVAMAKVGDFFVMAWGGTNINPNADAWIYRSLDGKVWTRCSSLSTSSAGPPSKGTQIRILPVSQAIVVAFQYSLYIAPDIASAFTHRYYIDSPPTWVDEASDSDDRIIFSTTKTTVMTLSGSMSSSPSMYFSNPVYRGCRGVIGSEKVLLFCDGGLAYTLSAPFTKNRFITPESWDSVVTRLSGRPLFASVLNGVCWAACRNGIVVNSSDGETFTKVGEIPFTGTVETFDTDGTKCVAISSAGELAQSLDGGVTWSVGTSDNVYADTCVHYGGEGKWFVTGWQTGVAKIDVLSAEIQQMNDAGGNPVREVGTWDASAGKGAITRGLPPVGGVCLAAFETMGFNRAAVHTWGAAPLLPGSFKIRAKSLSGEVLEASDVNQVLSGEASGSVYREKGYALCTFSGHIVPDSVEADYAYNTVFHSEFKDMDTRSLPLSGKVPVFKRGDVLLVTDRGRHQLSVAVEEGTTAIRIHPGTGLPPDFGAGLRFMIRDEVVLASGIVDGVLTVARGHGGTVAAAYPAGTFVDLHPEDRRMERVPVSEVLGKDFYTANAMAAGFTAGAVVASVIRTGEKFAQMDGWHTQQSWANIWTPSTDYSGSSASDTYNFTDHPLTLSNKGAVDEDWCLLVVATDPVRVNVIGKRLGLIAENLPVSAAIAPVNPMLNLPYWSLAAEGWGAGWQFGNCLRFRTQGTEIGLWAARCVNARASDQKDDSATIGVFGDVAT